MSIIYSAISFLVGGGMNVQSGVNGQIRIITDNPVFASCVNFAGGVALLFLLLIITGKSGAFPLPPSSQLKQTSWWMWIGGPLGVIYVMATAMLPLIIGYAAFFSMVVAGQLISSVYIDHKGWFGNDVQPVGFRRILGVVLLLSGAFLIQNT